MLFQIRLVSATQRGIRSVTEFTCARDLMILYMVDTGISGITTWSKTGNRWDGRRRLSTLIQLSLILAGQLPDAAGGVR